jgi:trk system potassium uptake protein TrkA
VVVALTPHDQDNLVACQLARQMYGVPRTVALVNDPENEAVFVELGVSVAFSATHIMANLIEQKMGFEGITALIPAAEGLVSMTEVVLRPGAPAIDHTLQELDLPENSLVACIVRDGQVMVPRGNSLLVAADRLILVTLPHSHGQTLRALLGPEV